MRESERIANLFTAFHEGNCWIGLNFTTVISDVDASKAVLSFQNGNCIWQLVNHLIYWRKTVIIRLQGILGNPSMPDMYLPDHKSQQAWDATLAHFDEVYKALLEQILQMEDDLLDLPSPMQEQSFHQLLMGCLQHDAYHLGQIVLLKKNL